MNFSTNTKTILKKKKQPYFEEEKCFFVLAEETTSLKCCLAAEQVLCFNKCSQKIWFIWETSWSKNKQAFSGSDSYWCCAMETFRSVPRFDTQSYLSLFTVCFVLLMNERAVVALSLISCEQVSVWQPHTLLSLLVSPRTFRRCVAYGLKIPCVEPGTCRRAGSCVGGRRACVLVLTWLRSLGEGLGDGAGRVTRPAVKQL